MTFANPLPWWGLVSAAAAAALVAWLSSSRAPVTSRRAALAAIRFVLLMLLLVLLMRPLHTGGGSGPSDAVVPILVDTSRSMSIEDADGRPRIERARDVVSAELLPALAARFATEVLGFGEQVAPADPADLGATARRTDLTGAIAAMRGRYRGRTVAGIVLVSDGGNTSEVTGAAGGPEGVPIFPVGIGSPSIARDREVLSVTAAEAVLDDARLELAVSAVSHGHGTSPIELRLLENGAPLEVRRAVPSADGVPVREVFHVAPPQGAATIYTVEIPAAAGEPVPENNTRSVLVRPPERARRVLLVQGAPGFEHSFLGRAWRADRGLEVDAVVRKGRDEQGHETFYIQAPAARAAALETGYPSTREALFAYDAVVLANVEGAQLTREQLEVTREFVGRRGGGLLVLGARSLLPRGLSDTPIEPLLPLEAAERGAGVLPASTKTAVAVNRVALTPAGEEHPIMQLAADPAETLKRWEAVPAFAGAAPLGGPRPGATVLALTGGQGGTPRPLVAVQRYGAGRSMVFTGEAAWRWRMMLPASDRSYDTFWRQALRWLSIAAPDPVAIRLPAGAAPGDVIAIHVDARGRDFLPLAAAAIEVRVTGPDGRAEGVPAVRDTPDDAGAFVARYRADQPGVYRIAADVRTSDGATASTSAALLVGGADAELTDPRLNRQVLERLAVASGGRMLEPGSAGALAGELRAVRPAPGAARGRDLWHNVWSFSLIVSLLAVEWTLRRRWGLR